MCLLLILILSEHFSGGILISVFIVSSAHFLTSTNMCDSRIVLSLNTIEACLYLIEMVVVYCKCIKQ